MNLINHDLQPSEERLYQQIVTTLSSQLSIYMSIIATLSQQLSWSHLIELIKIEDAPPRKCFRRSYTGQLLRHKPGLDIRKHPHE
jgi:hypothetical protein